MGDTTVLIVDDESRMRKLIKDFLMQKGYSILEAGDGEEALQVFEENQNKINLILLRCNDAKTRWLVCSSPNSSNFKSSNYNAYCKRRRTR